MLGSRVMIGPRVPAGDQESGAVWGCPVRAASSRALHSDTWPFQIRYPYFWLNCSSITLISRAACSTASFTPIGCLRTALISSVMRP